MRQLNLGRAFTLIEPGPVVLVTTNDGMKNNVMTISWTMVLDFIHPHPKFSRRLSIGLISRTCRVSS